VLTPQGEIGMQILSARSCALRMAILLCVVCALDIAAAILTAKPRLWCAIIPALIPIFMPAVIFTRRLPFRSSAG
jgi:hypothetical protein